MGYLQRSESACGGREYEYTTDRARARSAPSIDPQLPPQHRCSPRSSLLQLVRVGTLARPRLASGQLLRVLEMLLERRQRVLSEVHDLRVLAARRLLLVRRDVLLVIGDHRFRELAVERRAR